MNEDLPDLVKALRVQAGACRKMGSALNGDLLEHAAEDWLAGGPVRALLAPWAEADLKAQFDAAVPLRLIGGWHELALSGDDPDVSEAYRWADADAAWVAVRRASETRQERLAAFMTHEPQTNEVRRAICLLGGFLEVAQATGLPLRCFEVAASAGLNLSWDRFHYRLGAATWGDPSSPVTLDTEWSGPPPPIEAPVDVIERAACDRRPSGIATEAERRQLTSYIWADQTERLARLRAAIGMALGRGVEVEAADAVDWVRAHVAPKAATATVLYHSVFWQYMPASKQVELEGLIREIGAKASAEAPFAWLSMEPPPENLATMQVRLIMWPGGEPRILAEVHPHGAYVNWLGGANPS